MVDIVRSMTMVLAGYKAKQLLLVNHTTKIIHHYHRLVIVAKGFLKVFGSIYKNNQLKLEFLKAPFLVLHFS